jgi:uncharacterized protein (TIGR02466 family)
MDDARGALRQNPLGAGKSPALFFVRDPTLRFPRDGRVAVGDNPRMAHLTLFPTRVYRAALTPRGAPALNRQLLREISQLRLDDAAGRAWSAGNYPGGYTSYGSAFRMQTVSPTFAALERRLARHVRRFAQSLDFDLEGRELAMTDCWVNVMPRGVTHGLHLHPLSTVSGTYYVQVPRGAPGLKLEDPRLDRMMAAPPRHRGVRESNRPWVIVPAAAGHVVLFESWLRHEVPANRVAGERVSISFNYAWF